MIIKKLLILFLFIYCPLLMSQFIDKKPSSDRYKVLVLNSYHEGYKWSDNIMDGIKSEFSKELNSPEIAIEYMDTKINISETYLASLTTFLINKYSNKQFDLIIACDDAAYQFLQKHAQTLFPMTPTVFCGVNYLDESVVDRSLTTGIVESYDIEGTIKSAVQINPLIKHVYFINDKTVTGLLIEKTFRSYINKYHDHLTFEIVNDKTIAQLTSLLAEADDDSMAFFGIYFRDKNHQYYDYDESIKLLSENTNIPIYGMWSFLLGNGIVGGNLTSGYHQGTKAGQYAIQILKGKSPSELPIIKENRNNFQFDYKELQKHHIANTQLPMNSKIINQKLGYKKNILVLHSYDSKMKWVEEIDSGIESVLQSHKIKLNFDYMDTKRVGSPSFLSKVYEHTKIKHENVDYDLIIVSDNNAFTFALKNRNKLFKGTPIVFCGVNNFEEFRKDLPENITGIIEDIDVESTISLAIQQNPQVKNIYIVNDRTSTGKAINTIVESIENKYSALNFVYLSDINVSDLITKLSTLQKEDIVLLLSYTKDNSNNIFSYEEAGNIISSNATRPVYVVWDFYLDTGVLGGVVTSGYTQGKLAGEMALELIQGKTFKQVPIVFESPNQTILDANAIKKFAIKKKNIPQNSLIINLEKSFFETYWLLLLLTSILLLLMLMVYIDSRLKIMRSKKKQRALEEYASFDQLTSVYSRRKGLMLSQELMEKYPEDLFTICFIDLDNLKIINDKYGHEMGDKSIVDAIELIKQHIRKKDILFRYGGDEFIILFINTDQSDTNIIFERLYADMKSVNIHREIEIAFSYGLQSNDKGASLNDMIKLADENMYQHKKNRKKARSQ